MEKSSTSYLHLFSSFRLGAHSLKNRIVHAAMSTRFVEDGRVTDSLINYHSNRARGGAAMTVTEPLNLLSRQKDRRKVDVFSGRNDESLRRWAEAVERHDCRLLAQIQDPGRGRHEQGRNTSAIGASPLPDDLSWTVPHALSAAEIEQMVGEFAHSSQLLMKAGFSGVEISAGHGHLFHQFLSARSNQRQDKYGGDIEGRTRLLTELISAIRAECGEGFIIGVKLPAEDGMDGGIDLPEAKRITKLACLTKQVDYLTYCWGAHSNTLDWHLPDMHGPRTPFVQKIRELGRTAAPGVALGALGLITDPNEGERIIRDGLADLVMLGRPLVTDPAWGTKAYEGRESQIRYCVSCNTCWQVIVAGNRLQCDNNPRVGTVDEADWRPRKAAKKKNVVVVGGGIAGMEAAWVAAGRGHDVTVFSSSVETGGKTRLHASLPGGESLSSIYDFQRLSADRFGAKLQLGIRASEREIFALEPDVIVLATGSTPSWPDFLPQEYKELGVFNDLREAAARLLRYTGKQRGTAVIYDEDHTAMTYAAAEYFAEKFDRVAIVTPRERIANDESLVNRQGIYRRLYRKNIDVITLSRPLSSSPFEEGKIFYGNIYSGRQAAIDDVALFTYATPRLPNDGLAGPLRRAGYDIKLIGDCYAPRFVLTATAEGHQIGNEL